MKAELKLNGVNQIIKDTTIYEKGDDITSISLVVKGRIRICTEGVNVVVGSGNFLGLCDLSNQIHSVSYIAETNAVVYAFPKMHLTQAIRSLIKVNKDYAGLMVSTLSRYIRDLSKIYDQFEETTDELYGFLKDSDEKYNEIAREVGVRVEALRSISDLEEYEHGNVIDIDKVMYYRACCEVTPEIQKSFFGFNSTISVYHVLEQVELVNLLIDQCTQDARYIKYLAGPLIKDDRSLYIGIMQLATTLQRMGTDNSAIMSVFDDIIDKVNTVESMLLDNACIDLEIDHDFMEDAYFSLLNGDSGASSDNVLADMAITEDNMVNLDDLNGSLAFILDFSEIDLDEAKKFTDYIIQFEGLRDKLSTDDDVRTLRHSISKMYYDLYKKVFLKDYHSHEKTPLIIELFLRYGFLSEKLVSNELKEELLGIDNYDSGNNSCKVYDMKEWLTEILEGRKEPSKSEFDMDYHENLRDMRKTGNITEEQQKQLTTDTMAKFEYEVDNMFRTNHRLIYGQVSIFVPFLYTEGVTSSFARCFMSKDKINAAVHRLLQIDFSAFYRESLYTGDGEHIKKEYIMEEVFPDFIMFPTYGSNTVMWQEISGRRRNTPGRFLVPAFMDTDLDSAMLKLFGRFRWELCRTIQGTSWNNIQIKSLTSEYSDFVQFYRKNRDLSDDKKEKLKLQIQKCRNNTKEVFVIDYENWIKHEAHGGLCLSKPVREIMATYCPFSRELREGVMEQPLFRDAMAKFTRERGKKKKEYDLKFRVWDKDKVEVPESIKSTRDFYVEM